MSQQVVKEGWYHVKWPGKEQRELVEIVRIGKGDDLEAWGYRGDTAEQTNPINAKYPSDIGLDAIPVHIISDLQQLIAETRPFGLKAFYRGQRKHDWDLVPAVFRTPHAFIEQTMLADFRLRAPVRYANTPPYDDLTSWLALAQHYGLPTRLLDWTLSPLIAAYFATEPDVTDDKSAGIVWVLDPVELNKRASGNDGVLSFSMDNDDVVKLVQPAFEIEYGSIESVLAVVPSEKDTRYFVQQSAFTLHGNGTSLQGWRNKLMPEIADHRKLMMCACIPPSSKISIRDDLERLGIHEASLFPDLSNLARYIRRDKRHRKRLEQAPD